MIAPLAEKIEELTFKLDENYAHDAGTKQSWMRLNSLMAFLPPAPFSGSFGEQFTDWLERFNQYMTLQGIGDQEDAYKIAFLESNLIGGALASLHELKKDSVNPVTYDLLVRGLKDMYPDGRDSDVHQQMIFDRKQRYNESVMEYFDKLKKLVRSAYPTLREDARDLILKPIFIRGLLANIYEGIKYRNFVNVQEALKAARFAESQLFRDDLYRQPKMETPINTVNVSGTTMESLKRELKQEISDLRSILLKRPHPQQGDNRRMECSRCGKAGQGQ